jgi:hypothetical protein
MNTILNLTLFSFSAIQIKAALGRIGGDVNAVQSIRISNCVDCQRIRQVLLLNVLACCSTISKSD